ncbi:MAG: UDP-N-acetylmuramate dehydrogenase [Bacilli bacterium]|nr:UDP-N-acetylmuramate dehydrogenase [Bacilli bacterium]
MIKSFIDKNNYEYYEDVSLKKYNTYKLNSKAKYLVFPKNIAELKKLINFVKKNNIKHLVLGNGSNVIFHCDYYDGVVIRLDRFNSIKVVDTTVFVGAGYSLIKLAVGMANKGLSGLEFSSGIPGFVGASVAMNAGAYTFSLSELVQSAEVLCPDGKIRTFSKEEMEFGYRDSFFKRNKDYIILSCELKLHKGDKEEILDKIADRKLRRIESQPLDYPSAGSVFRNPDGLYAGKMIEEVGLKGYKIGGAMVSLKHANFIINYDNATGEDIVNLINLIKKEVKNKYNINLILEQIIID